MNSEKKIKSVVKAFSIIDILVENNGSMSLSNIATNLSMPVSTIHGLVTTLLDLGYINLNQNNGQYELSAKFFEVGCATSNNWVQLDKIEKVLVNFSKRIDETLVISKLVDNYSMCLFKRDSTNSAISQVSIGHKVMAHTVSSGKCLLAYLDGDEARYLLNKEELTTSTKNTITGIEEMLKELALIRQKGYALDNEEYVNGICAISKPIFNEDNIAVAAITILFIKEKLSLKYIEGLDIQLSKIIKKISKQMTGL